MFKFGDWVVYDPGYKKEIGRVAKVSPNGKSVWVCYHEGCTAASTPVEYLSPYNPEVHTDLTPNDKIGFHRFDWNCPKYDPEACGNCRSWVAENYSDLTEIDS